MSAEFDQKQNVMKGLVVYPNAIVPGATGLYLWGFDGVESKELKLKSQLAEDQDIARMSLKIRMITAVDINGNQTKMFDFSDQPILETQKLSRTRQLNLDGVGALKEGTYTKFKFYIEAAESDLVGTDGRAIQPSGACIEFSLEKPLEVRKNMKAELELSFDLPKMNLFSFKAWTGWVSDVFSRSGSKPAFRIA